MKDVGTDSARSAKPAGRATLLELAGAVLRGDLPPDDALMQGSGEIAGQDAAREHWASTLNVWPEDLAAWTATGAYTLRYGGPFRVEETLRYLARDPNNHAEQVQGSIYTRHFRLDGAERLVRLEIAEEGARAAMHPPGPATPDQWAPLHTLLTRQLGLGQPLAEFYGAVAERSVLAPWLERLHGLRVPLVPTVWEGLCWAVVGQQINLAFAYKLRNALITLGNGLPWDGTNRRPPEPLPFPNPQQVLAIADDAWRPAQYSARKSEYLRVIARAFDEGQLSEEGLRAMDGDTLTETLSALKGVGPWTVNYVRLRSLGDMDALPAGDAGLKNALHRLHGLTAPPGPEEQTRLMEEFRPYRGLATYYLWKILNADRQD